MNDNEHYEERFSLPLAFHQRKNVSGMLTFHSPPLILELQYIALLFTTQMFSLEDTYCAVSACNEKKIVKVNEIITKLIVLSL